MYRFIRYFNQNRKKIYRIIIIIVAGLMVLYFFNYKISVNMENIQNNNSSTESNEIQNTSNNSNVNTNSAITGGDGGTTATKQTDIIEQFIKYCNEGNPTEAYNMLSTSCQEEMYPTLKSFTKGYYEDNFYESKSYKIQRWSGTTYKVNYKEDMLHTGNYTAGGKQDYITVTKEDEQYKLNINSYIGRTYLSKETTSNNITIQVAYKDTYMDNEIYVFKVKNNNDFDIYLGDKQNTETIYLTDSNDIKYESYINEITKEELHVYAHVEKQIKISFSNNFITGRKYSQIIFENVTSEELSEEQKIVLNLN